MANILISTPKHTHLQIYIYLYLLSFQRININNSLIYRIGARSDEFDAFFATPSGNPSGGGGSGQTSGGLNGVATYVRKGLTIKASSNVLDNGVSQT